MEVDSLNIQITADVANAAQSIGNVENELNKLGNSADSAGSDVSRLVAEMSAAASNMANVSGNIETSSSGLVGFQSNIDAVSNTLTGLNFKFDYLRDSVQGSYGAFDSASASVTNLSAASEASAAALNNIAAATDGFGSRMGELQTSTSGTAEGMAALQRELTDALSQMRSFSDNMGNAGKDAEDAAKKIKELSQEVKNLPNKQVYDLASGFKTLKGVVATLGIGKFVKDCNDAYNVQMQNELKLAAHMKHRMNATDDEIKSIKELASAQQKIGVIGDEIQLAGAQQLTTYARQASTLQTLIPAMNNLIAQQAGYEASVGDATSAADMLGRALNGQYTSLKRMGVVFTSAQENVLKYGTETQKAAVLADAINSKVGNMNELLANTPTGALKQLQNDFGDLQEQIGATFQPLISSVVPVLSQVLTDLKGPILAVSSGISTIGIAISKLDPAIIRTVGYAGAAIYMMKKFKTTASGLLGLLITVSSFAASMMNHLVGDSPVKDKENSVEGIIRRAMAAAQMTANAVENANEDAGESVGDLSGQYDNLNKTVEKTISRLAGFDTITQLSGTGSSGVLTDYLIGSNGTSALTAYTASINGLSDAFSDIDDPDVDFSDFNYSLSEADDSMKIFGIDFDEFCKQWEFGAKQFVKWEEKIRDAMIGFMEKTAEFFGFGKDSDARFMMSNQAAFQDPLRYVKIFDERLGIEIPESKKAFAEAFEKAAKEGLSVNQAFDYATVNQIFEKRTDLQDKLDDVYGNNSVRALVSMVPSASDRYDVPMSSGVIPTNVPAENITVNLNVDSEQLASVTLNQQDLQAGLDNFRNR